MRSMLASTTVCVAVLASPALSTELSANAVAERFIQQREVVRSATDPNAPKTRSLVAGRGLELITPGSERTDSGNAPTTAPDAPIDPNTPFIARFDPSLVVDIRVKFDFDSAALSDAQAPALARICEAMKIASDVRLFRVIGHTDASGSDAYNEKLSQLRAEEVGRYLVNDCGIAASRLETVGYGERFLLSPGNPEADENRRVEFQALS